MVSFIKYDMPYIIKKTIYKLGFNELNYTCYGSVGQMNRWANVPWISIMDKDITTTARDGFYITYLFKKDMSGFYISLMWTIDFFNNIQLNKEDISDEFKNLIRSSFKDFDFLEEVDLCDKCQGLKKKKKKSVIIAKEYDLSNFPTEDELEKDLKDFMKVYSFLKPYFFDLII